jgi:hypothetical protein
MCDAQGSNPAVSMHIDNDQHEYVCWHFITIHNLNNILPLLRAWSDVYVHLIALLTSHLIFVVGLAVSDSSLQRQCARAYAVQVLKAFDLSWSQCQHIDFRWI